LTDLIPKLVPLKGIYNAEIGAISLCDCSFSHDAKTGVPILKFSIAIANIGRGPLHIVLGDLHNNKNGKQTAPANQVIYDEHGGTREVGVGEFELHIHEEHDMRHWHYDGLASLDLVNDDDLIVERSKKDGYCVIDYFKYQDLPNAPEQRKFGLNACEGKKPEVGISVGWADSYDDSSVDQAIELSNVKSGEYWLRFKINETEMVYEYTEPALLRISIDKENEKVKLIDSSCLPK
jgi:hypothetical protein